MTIEEVEQEIERSLECGYFQSLTEFTPDVVGVAVPFPAGDWRLALSVAGPTFQSGPRLAVLGAMARAAVDRFLGSGAN
jgi:IclR family acetate operon transcriptional repressor